jgi:hypothetical protein
MANWPKFGFTLFARRRSGKLTVCRCLKDREAAAKAAVQFAKIRPIGLEDLFIRCDADRPRRVRGVP